MNIKQKIIRMTVFTGVITLLSSVCVLAAPVSHAAPSQVTCQDGTKVAKKANLSTAQACKGHTGKKDASAKSDSGSGSGGECEVSILPKSFCDGSKGEGIWALLNLIVDILTAGIGILAIGGVVYGSILYASAADNSSQVQKAKGTIGNVVIGLIAYAIFWAFLQYLIPGGVF